MSSHTTPLEDLGDELDRLSERLNSLHAELRNLGSLVSETNPGKHNAAVEEAAEATDIASRRIRDAKQELAALVVGAAL